MRKVFKTMLNRANTDLSETFEIQVTFPFSGELTTYYPITTALDSVSGINVCCRHD